MHILIVTTGGVTRLFRNWPELLLGKALAQRGHDVTAFTYLDPRAPGLREPEEEIEGIRVRRFSPRGWYTAGLSRALARLPRPDVVHLFHLRNYFSFQTGWKMRSAGAPFVLTPIGPLHDPYLVADRDRPLDAPPRWGNLILSRRALLNRVAHDGKVKRHVENFLMHWPLRQANRLIASSEHERGLWAQIGLPSETIPLWIDEEFVRAHRGERYEAAAAWTRPIVLFVAQLKYRKGFDVLARAMPYVTAQQPGATFVFVSHSPIHRRELERIADETGTRANLQILERLDEVDKARLYNTADLLAFPTRYEGFGLPLLEAMAAGCAVVASNIPVVDEIARHDENALLVPRDDPAALGAAITRLAADPALRARLVARGYETLARFREAELVERVERVYRQVAREARADPS